MKNFSMGREGYIPAPEKEEGPELEESLEDGFEREDIKVETVADFIRALELSYDTTEDIKEKQKIGHQIVKINMSLNATEFTADKLKVEDMEAGVLGKHYPGSGRTAISAELLNDFSVSSSLIIHVMDHELEHRKGTADEGPVELKLKRKLPTTISFYVSEQQKTKRAFYNVGTKKGLDLYDMDKPNELADCYLQVEIEKKYKNSKTELKELQRDSYLKLRTDKETDSLSKKLKDGVPRFYEKLSEGHIRKQIKSILEDLRNS